MKKNIFLMMLMACLVAPLNGLADDVIRLDEVVVTATRSEEKVSSIPANVTIVTEEKIKTSTAQNIPDLLRSEVGVHVNDIAGNRRNMTVDLRGFGETATLNTLVLVDGRRVNEADLSGTDWAQIPLDRVAKIEIIRGGTGSVLYGDSATGGVINIITKKGAGLNAGAGISSGSYDTYKGNAYFSGSSKTVAYSFNGSYLNSDGYRDNSETEAKDIGANLEYFLTDAISLNLSAGYHKDNTGLPGGLKESDFAAGRSRTETVNPKDFSEIEDYYFKGGPEFYFQDDSLFKIDFSHRKRSLLTFSSFVGGNFLGDTEIKTTAISPQIVLKTDPGNMRNELTLGYDYQNAEENIINNSSFSGKARFELERKNQGYYLHDELDVTKDLVLSGGYRYDESDFSFRPSTPSDVSMDEEVYSAGVNYSYLGGSYAYFSYARSFRYPVLDELFNFITNSIDTALIPQKSHHYELGIRHHVNDDLYIHLNLFRIDSNDEIIYNPDIGFFGANDNLDGKTRRDGIEVSVHAEPVEWLLINSSYSYTDASIKGGMFEDSDIPNVPDHQATIETVFSVANGFSIAFNGNYVGKRHFISDFSNQFSQQEDYVILNSKIKYNWKNITAFIDLNNLTDKEFSEFGTLSLFSFPVEKAEYPSPEFNMLFGISVEI